MSKVLIIEDEQELLNNIASYLSSFESEFEVLTATTGEDGLAILESQSKIDILLTDVRLPGIDGIEVVRRTVESWPTVRIVVMTAFGSADLRSAMENAGALRFIEKPIDLDALPDILREVHDRGHRRSRAVGGLEILDVAQFIAVARETKVVCFKADRGEGTVVFENGVIVHCSAGTLEGADAFLDMVLWGEGSFWELFDVETRRFRRNVEMPTVALLNQATQFSAELQDADPFDLEDASGPADPAGSGRSEQGAATATPTTKQAATTAATGGKGATKHARPENRSIKDHLGELHSFEGFSAAGVFSAQGELIESIAVGELDFKEIGLYANNALLNAQKATEQMGLGRGKEMQIRAPHATVLMCCHNEATDSSSSAAGRLHFHTVVVLASDASTAMASWILTRVTDKIAAALR